MIDQSYGKQTGAELELNEMTEVKLIVVWGMYVFVIHFVKLLALTRPMIISPGSQLWG